MKKTNYKPNDEIIVEKESLLLEFLLANIKNKSKNNIKSNLARGNVSIDNKKTTKYDYELKKGQKVIVKWAHIKTDEKEEALDVIYEDNDILAINKPSGLLTISTESEKENTAYRIVMNYLKSKKQSNKVFIVHRLDRDTSGILIFAKTEKMKHILQENWEDLIITRGYVAIVEGILDKKVGTIKSWLKENKGFTVYSSNKQNDGKLAITNYEVIKENDLYSMLDIKLSTGRKNQIRVHMKDINHSVIGDKKYGSTKDPLKRLGLHAHLLELKHPFTKKTMTFKAEVPSNFKTLFKNKK